MGEAFENDSATCQRLSLQVLDVTVVRKRSNFEKLTNKLLKKNNNQENKSDSITLMLQILVRAFKTKSKEQQDSVTIQLDTWH